jgi:uncharacterized damage-inducible protein DinB
MSAQQPWHLLHGYLAWTRSHVLSAVADLDDDELRAPRVPSGWSMAELVHHLAVDVERFWFLAVMAADPEAVGYFEEATASGWTIPAHLAPSGVLDLYRDECAKTDAYLANAAEDSAPRWWPTGPDDEPPADLAAVFVHALVDTATHAGHLDIVRELVDGKQFLVLDR